MTQKFAERINLVRPSAIRELLRLGDDPSITSFGGGYPDPLLFPLAELRATYADVLGDSGRGNLQYTSSIGNPRLREIIAERARGDGMNVDASDVLILHGAQQGLDLVAKMMIDPGASIITENPTFLGALIAFNPYEPNYVAIDIDDGGMKMNELRRALERTPDARFIYVIPDFQNPTGACLSLERRHQLLDLANEFDVLVLEDTPYRELRFEGQNLPTLFSLDTDGRVIHLGSFSKTLAPGMRLGWGLAAPHLLDKLALLKLAADTQSSTLNMAAASRFLDKFDLDTHVQLARASYRRKRDLMISSMEASFPAEVTFTRPSGGLFTWVTFPDGFDTARFMSERALPVARVAYVPGGSFFPRGDRPNFARFSYAGVGDEEMTAAITRLGELITTDLRA